MKRVVDKEQFFTKPELAKVCLDFLFLRYKKHDFDLFLEPSAGAGSFFDIMPSPKIGIDIDPKKPDIVQADFFDFVPDPKYRKILTIGNPPFGARASMALKFLKRSMSFSEVVAMILPRIFNKYTFHDSLPLNFHLVDYFNCADFEDVEGSSLKIKCAFQIWEKRNVLRQKTKNITEHEDFDISHHHYSRITDEQKRNLSAYDFAIPQVGAYKVMNSLEVKAGSFWYIKPRHEYVRRIFENMDFSYLDDQNTTFRSLSIHDIITNYITTKDETLSI